jgi:hypothetical protein
MLRHRQGNVSTHSLSRRRPRYRATTNRGTNRPRRTEQHRPRLDGRDLVYSGSEIRDARASRRQSTFRRIPANGHMIHQTATNQLMAAITEVASDRPHLD